MSRLLWVIIAVSLILTGLVAVDSASWLSGRYAVPPLERLWPFLLTILVYVILLVAAERHLAQRQSEPGFREPAIALLAMAMVLIGLQLAAMYMANPAPVSDVFRRTVTLGSGGYLAVSQCRADPTPGLRVSIHRVGLLAGPGCSASPA